MSKISSMMDVGKRSMANSQTSLQTVSHNIANKSTEGYSRQRVETLSNAPVGQGHLQIGMGARASSISRTNNPWLEKQIQREGTNMGFMDGKADAMMRVEQVYNEQQNKGLNQYMTDFFNGFRELSANPESLAGRTLVRESAISLAQDFQRVTGQLRAVQQDIDAQLTTTVQEVNAMTKEIADLNSKIAQVEHQGKDVVANDERDRRDLLLKKLGEKIEITYAEGSDSIVTVTAGRTAVLVSGFDAQELRVHNSGERGRVELWYRSSENGSDFNVTQQMKGGRVGGLLEVRDDVIENMLGNVDELAHTFAHEVNRAHEMGFDRYGNQGNQIFEIQDDVKDAAEHIQVDTQLLNDVGLVAASARKDSPGDNSIANVISSMQYQKKMEDGASTYDDFYAAQVGQIGTMTQKAVKSQEVQKNSMNQLNNIRESISGVSLDEETTKMIEFQKAYDASARLIRTADEMFDTILNLKRM
jgi:flagellar hook-associated protein 1 FlgK